MNRLIVVIGVLTLALTGCQHAIELEGPTPDLDRPDAFVGGGVSFAYPGNWALKEDVNALDDGEIRSISVGVPGVGGAYLRVFSPPPPDLDFQKFIEGFSENLEARTPSFMQLWRMSEAEVAQVVAGQERQGVRREYAWKLLMQTFRTAIEFHRVDVDERSVFVVTVVGGGDPTIGNGFELIRQSLRVRSGKDISHALQRLRTSSGSTHDAAVNGESESSVRFLDD